MKKKAGTFFKSVLTKGKNMFKKEQTSDDRKNEEKDYNTDEDTDIIEVGKNTNGKQPANYLLSNLSGFAESTLSAADELIHGISL